MEWINCILDTEFVETLQINTKHISYLVSDKNYKVRLHMTNGDVLWVKNSLTDINNMINHTEDE